MFRFDLIKNVVDRETLVTIAERSGVCIQTVARARDGENLSIKSLSAVAKACELDMRELFTFNETNEKALTV